MVAAAIIGAGVLGAGASVASGAIGASAAKSAAKTQAAAANNAAQAQLQMFHEQEANLAPYVTAGTSAMGELQGLTGTNAGGNPLTAPLSAPFQPTMAQLARTPGYQFTLQQGLESTQNSYAAQGLASSGAAMKGASQYAEGLASTTYQQQFQNYLAQNQQIYNMLSGQANLGENAAAMTGQMGMQAQTTANQLTTSGAAASAAGTIGSANALTGALGGLTGSASNTALLLALNNSGMFSGNALVGAGDGLLGGSVQA